MTNLRPPASDATLHLPRILCLHGGGTNSGIFRMQCRGLEHHLRPHFRLVYAEAPFPSTAGPDVLSVFAECGPFKRWVLQMQPNAVETQPKETWEGVEKALGDCMDADDKEGATGEWVAVLGFSQGAKMAASLLLRQQVEPETLGRVRRGRGFRFGVLMAGRAPLLQVDVNDNTGWEDGAKFDYASNLAAKRVVKIPTIHVHGLQDPGIYFHRVMYREWFEPGTKELIEWHADHRLPIKTHDVTTVCNEILKMAKETGISVGPK